MFYHYATNLFYKTLLIKTDRLVSVLIADLCLIENMILNSAHHVFTSVGLTSWAQLALKDGGEYSYYFGWPCTQLKIVDLILWKKRTLQVKGQPALFATVCSPGTHECLCTLPPTLSILHPGKIASKPHPVQDLEVMVLDYSSSSRGSLWASDP